MKHYTIPIFIPELACPFRCIYCNQHVITSQEGIPNEIEIIETIESHLKTFSKGANVQIGFYGGTFTGLSLKQQEYLLQLAKPYLEKGLIHSLKLSTRPDYITAENLKLLKDFGVKEIELGIQSFDEEVLLQSKRGYTVRQIEESAELIKSFGFDLGMQMMLGLPADTKEKTVYTAQRIIACGAKTTRIYPTLVIENTDLAELYTEGKYAVLSMGEAVDWAKEVSLLFEHANVTILRMGLHPTKDFLQGQGFLAGPFHVSFKELVLSSIWQDILQPLMEKYPKGSSLKIGVNPNELNAAVGYNAANKKMLSEYFKDVRFFACPNLNGRRETSITKI